MKNLKIVVGGKNYSADIPESWNEVPADIYKELARIYVAGPERMNEFDKLVRVFALLGFKAWKGIKQLTDEQLLEVLPLIHWVFGDLDLSENKIPELQLPNATWLGPANGLDNLRFGEFCMAESYFTNYNETKDAKYLDLLIATLYRPVGIGEQFTPEHSTYRGDRREKFNSSLTENRAKLILTVDLATKDGIYLFYASARSQLFQYFPNVFRRQSAAKSTAKKGIEFGWLGVFDDLLGEKGRTSESLEDEFVSTVLMSIERNQQKYKERSRKK